MKLTVTLAVASLLGQADTRADGWTTTDYMIQPDEYDSYRTDSMSSYVSFEDDFVKKSEYSSEVEEYGVINWMQFCYDPITYKSKIEWSYHNICDSQDEYTTNSQITLNNDDKYGVGDTDHAFSASECDDIDRLEPGECITDVSFYESQGATYGIIYSTNLGVEDVFFLVALVAQSKATYTPSYMRQTVQYSYDDSKKIIDAPMTTSTTEANEQLVCLTALEVEYMSFPLFDMKSALDYKVSYKPDSWSYNSTHCESHRTGAAGGAIAGAVIGVCCVGGIALAVWFFCIRRTGSAGSLQADELKPGTPEAAPQTTTTTTIIQQQPAMMMQPQQMMMQQQPMMMQQQPMMMQQPGMVMQQPGMVMQQPGMVQMQPGMAAPQQVYYQ